MSYNSVLLLGVPKLITSDMVKEGAAVIDVGINYVHDPTTGKTIALTRRLLAK